MHAGRGEAAAQRRPASRTRVRSGCITCKIRKVKCDEGRPSCHKCTSTGRSCDGYAHVEAKTSVKASLGYSSRTAAGNLERQALYMFRTKVASRLATSLDIDFWTRDIPLAAEAFVSVRHAVAALAMAYDDFATPLKAAHVGQRGGFILDQYTKSITSLRICLSRKTLVTRRQHIVILVANLLFTSLCAVQGLRREACEHLRSGLAILRELNYTDVGAAAADQGAYGITPLQLLVAAYTRLDTQARVIIQASGRKDNMRLWKPHSAVLCGWGSGPAAVVRAAFVEMEALHNTVLQLRVSSAEEPVYDDSTTVAVTLAVEQCRRQIWLWDNKYTWLLHNKAGGKRVVNELHTRRVLAGANLALLTRQVLRTGSTEPDDLGQPCKMLLELSRQTMSDPWCSKGQGHARFNPTGVLIEALYFVARHGSKTSSSLGEEAIVLLKGYRGIEGLWKSESAVVAAAAGKAPNGE